MEANKGTQDGKGNGNRDGGRDPWTNIEWKRGRERGRKREQWRKLERERGCERERKRDRDRGGLRRGGEGKETAQVL